MIEHLRGRDRKLEPLGWTGQHAEWIALVCLHSGVFTRGQFCLFRYGSPTGTSIRQVIDPAAGGGREQTHYVLGTKLCRISSNAIYRALPRTSATGEGPARRLSCGGFCRSFMIWNSPPSRRRSSFLKRSACRALDSAPDTVWRATAALPLKLPLAVEPEIVTFVRRSGPPDAYRTPRVPRMGRFGMRFARRGGRFAWSELPLKMPSWTVDRVLEKWAALRQGKPSELTPKQEIDRPMKDDDEFLAPYGDSGEPCSGFYKMPKPTSRKESD